MKNDNICALEKTNHEFCKFIVFGGITQARCISVVCVYVCVCGGGGGTFQERMTFS